MSGTTKRDSRTPEARAASAIRSVAKHSGNDAALQTCYATLRELGFTPRHLVQATVDEAGGILGAKEVAQVLTSHTDHFNPVAPTNIGKNTAASKRHGLPKLEPFARASGNHPLYLRYEVEPYRIKLWNYRENRVRRMQEKDIEGTAEELETVPVPYTNGDRAG